MIEIIKSAVELSCPVIFFFLCAVLLRCCSFGNSVVTPLQTLAVNTAANSAAAAAAAIIDSLTSIHLGA